MRQDRVRQRQREQVNSQDLTQSFRLPISGRAGTGIGYTATDILHFDSPFRPEQGTDAKLSRPTFTFGFELNEKNDPANNRSDMDINGLTGFAKVVKWVENGKGYVIGVRCHIGVLLLTSQFAEMDYTGSVHLQFTGPVLMTHDYTGGAS